MILRRLLRSALLATAPFLGLVLAGLSPTAALAQTWGRSTYSSPIAINGNDHLIWVVNPSDDSVSVIRPDNNTRLAKISVVAIDPGIRREPQSVALTPDNQWAYVANAAAGSVTIIRISDPLWGT